MELIDLGDEIMCNGIVYNSDKAGSWNNDNYWLVETVDNDQRSILFGFHSTRKNGNGSEMVWKFFCGRKNTAINTMERRYLYTCKQISLSRTRKFVYIYGVNPFDEPEKTFNLKLEIQQRPIKVAFFNSSSDCWKQRNNDQLSLDNSFIQFEGKVTSQGLPVSIRSSARELKDRHDNNSRVIVVDTNDVKNEYIVCSDDADKVYFYLYRKKNFGDKNLYWNVYVNKGNDVTFSLPSTVLKPTFKVQVQQIDGDQINITLDGVAMNTLHPMIVFTYGNKENVISDWVTLSSQEKPPPEENMVKVDTNIDGRLRNQGKTDFKQRFKAERWDRDFTKRAKFEAGLVRSISQAAGFI